MKKYRFIGDPKEYNGDENEDYVLRYGAILEEDAIPKEWSYNVKWHVDRHPTDWEEFIDPEVEKKEILDVVNKPLKFDTKIELVLEGIKEMLIQKNKKYGDSALNPLRLFSKSSSQEQLKVRIDDKLSRLKTQDISEDEDVVDDLIGYLVLYKISILDGKKV
jgi:hypothetical protein